MTGFNNKKKLPFLLELRIKDGDGTIIKLRKEEILEITWVNLNGEEKGILNPGELETYRDEITGKTIETMSSQGKIVQFEKDEKTFKVLVKIGSMTKGWFKDSLTNFGFLPAEGEKFTIYNEDKGFYSKTISSRQESDECIIPKKIRYEGYLLVGSLIALVIGIGIYFLIKKKQR